MTNARITLFSSAWIILLTAACFARQQETAPSHPDPVELVRKAVRNEISASGADANDRFMFRSTKTTPKGSTTKLFVESQEGTAGVAVAYDGKPLTPDQRRNEQARVQRFVKNPAELNKKRKQEREDQEHTLRIMRAIPDAFLFEYVGKETGSEGIGRPGDPLIKLKFRPNPSYQPPSRVEQVLTGMQGIIMVDAARYRIASIDGTLFRDVNFGWGILGHLDRGGHFQVQQREIEQNRWDISRIALDFTGKALLVKNLTIRSTEVFTDFKKVPPDLTFAQAVELLEKEQTATVENQTSSKLALK